MILKGHERYEKGTLFESLYRHRVQQEWHGYPATRSINTGGSDEG